MEAPVSYCQDITELEAQTGHVKSCNRVFKSLLFIRVLGEESGFGIVYEILYNRAIRYAMKVTAFGQYSLTELKILCKMSSSRITQQTNCLSGLKMWFLCSKPPEVFQEARQPPSIYVKQWQEGTLIYLFMELAEFSLNMPNIQTMLTQQYILNIFFECIWALAISRKEYSLSQNDIKADNILIRIEVRPRVYQIGSSTHDVQGQGSSTHYYEIISQYQPIIADYGNASFEPSDNDDAIQLVGLIADLLNQVEEDLTEQTLIQFDEVQTILGQASQADNYLDLIRAIQTDLFEPFRINLDQISPLARIYTLI